MFRTLKFTSLWLVFYILTSCATTNSLPTVSEGELTVALYPGFAPVVFRDPMSGKITGIDKDILQAFADQHNLQLKILERSFDGIWKLPAQGVVDIAGSGISELDSRLVDGMRWSGHYFEVRRSLSIRAADSDRLKTIDDFDGLDIAYTPGSTGELDSRERASSLVKLLPYEDEELAIEDLRSGKIDAIARGDVSSLYDAKVNTDLSVADLHYYDPREYFVFAVPDNNIELIKALNAFLVDMTVSGAVDDIVAGYLEAN